MKCVGGRDTTLECIYGSSRVYRVVEVEREEERDEGSESLFSTSHSTRTVMLNNDLLRTALVRPASILESPTR